MKGDPEFVILRHAAWMSANMENNILGAIVKNPLSPSTDYVPDSPVQYNKYNLQEVEANEFIIDNTGASAAEVSGAITKLAGFSVKGKTEDKIHLMGKLIRIKRLQQIDKFWAGLRADADVKSTAPGWISFFNTWPVCMVVGIMICEETGLNSNMARSAQHEANGQVPVGAMSLAAGAPNPLGNSVDPKLAINKSREGATSFEGRFNDGQVFAVELRKITTELFNWKELQLRSGGVDKIDPSRLAGIGGDEDVDLEKPIDPEELICVDIDPEDIEDMVSVEL